MKDKTITQLYVSKSMNKDKKEDSLEDNQLIDLQHIRKKTTNRISLRKIIRIILITKMKSMFRNEIEKWPRSISRSLIPFRKETCISLQNSNTSTIHNFCLEATWKNLQQWKLCSNIKENVRKTHFVLWVFPQRKPLILKIFSKNPIVLEFLLMVNAD